MKERAHAILSASGSKRWMNCPPSALEEEKLPDQTSEFAKEGSLAHDISEQYARAELGEIKQATLVRKVNKFKKDPLFSNIMLDHAEEYTAIIMERFTDLLLDSPGATVLLERQLDYSEYVLEGFGRGDCCILSDTVAEVIDYKYGKGVRVFAKDNTQMMLYGLALVQMYGFIYEFDTVRMTIHQPRLDHIDTYEMSVEDLVKWGEDTVAPAAKLAWSGGGEFCAGGWCQFCKLEGNCRARIDHFLEMEEFDYAEPATMSNYELAEILNKVRELKKWAEKVDKFCTKEAEKGVIFPDWKLVEGRSNRKITDPDEAVVILTGAGFSEDELYKKKMIGMGDMEKLVGKKNLVELIGQLIIKPQGKPALVPESDKRQPLNDPEKDFDGLFESEVENG